jgi:beta-N-acetylhexosaminidase|tara:strand:- start:10343 stop:11377 length:1035 start_codon:yes stop_codon:yes gene_type:complete
MSMAGRVILDIAGFELTDRDRERLVHPRCAGVILFARNFKNKSQLQQLVLDMKSIKQEPLMVCVDQEGGRVQRFQEEFTRIPPMDMLGRLWDQDQNHACAIARHIGIILGSELKAIGIDLTFAPVLDINRKNSSVIGDRAFHEDHEAISELGRKLVEGLRLSGVGSVGKHFPGHGGVSEDTHEDEAIDTRDISEMLSQDIRPFDALTPSLTGIMPAHVTFPSVDADPACFSSKWLREILRDHLGFEGLVFSDDLSMKAATLMGDMALRSSKAFEAGCDLVLVCNDPDAADDALSACMNIDFSDDQDVAKKMRGLIEMPISISISSVEYKVSSKELMRTLAANIN